MTFKTFLQNIKNGTIRAYKYITGKAPKLEQILIAEKTLTPEFLPAIKAVVTDLTQLSVAIPALLNNKGLNLAVDSAEYALLIKLIADFQPFAKTINDAIVIIEEK